MRYLVVLVICFLFPFISYPQVKSISLSNKVDLTYKDLLKIKLQLLATEISCGSFKIVDMGKLDFPVTIGLNDKDVIEFTIEGNIQKDLSKNLHEEIITESFEFVETSIRELLRREFPGLDPDSFKYIIGYWYYENTSLPKAKWISGNFSWI